MVQEELLFGIDDVLAKVPRRRVTRRRAFISTGLLTDEIETDEEDNVIKQEDSTVLETNQARKRKRETLPLPISAKGTLICAVDFGMTNSGLAYSDDKANPEFITCLKNYPGNREVRSKVSTVIAYQEENQSHIKFRGGEEGSSSKSIFGFEVDVNMVRHAFYKKALDQDAAATAFDDPALEQAPMTMLLRSSTGERGLQAVKDTLSHLHKIMMLKIAVELGDNFLDRYILKIVLTHPAAMSERGRANLRIAAVAGGWNASEDSTIVLRSEADSAIAAVFVLNRAKYGTHAWMDAFKRKSGVTVMDIGGYTSDSSTFFVKKNDPHLVVDQICAPQGGKCGTVALYCRLHQYLANIFGNRFTLLPESTTGHGSPLLRDFEEELRIFDENNLDKEYQLRLLIDGFEHDKYDDLDGVVILDGHEIKAIMDENLRYIEFILDDQFSAARKCGKEVETVVLCGGGSMFPYFYSQLKKFCHEHELGPKLLLRPDDPLAAVSVGALISCLQLKVLGKRKSRACYGVKVHRKFEPGDWDQDNIFECEYGKQRINGFMAWHVLKGDVVDPQRPGIGKTIPGYSIIDTNDLDNIHHKRVYIYSYSGDDQTPPERVEHPAVRKVGSFIVDLSAMSSNMKQKLKRQNRNKRTTKVEVKIVQLINVESGLIEFEARVGYTVVGRYQLDFDATTPCKETESLGGGCSQTGDFIAKKQQHFRFPNDAGTHVVMSDENEASLNSSLNQLVVQNDKLYLLQNLYKTLEDLAYIQVACLYYVDNSFVLTLLRASTIVNILPQASKHRLPLVLLVNAGCMFAHLFNDRPAPATHGARMLSGGLLVDFCGEYAYTSKLKLIVLDSIILSIMLFMLFVASQKPQSKADVAKPEETAIDPRTLEEGTQGGIEAADVEDENQALSSEDTSLGSPRIIEINIAEGLRGIVTDPVRPDTDPPTRNRETLRALIAAVATRATRR